MKPKLCLGTAQFGLHYGITNSAGQVPEKVASEIISYAEKAGVHFIDTAQVYGNAEAVLGRQLGVSHNFRLISKFPPQSQQVFIAQNVSTWENTILKSCQRLRVKKIDAYIVHNTSDLLKPGGKHLEDWLLSLRERGIVNRLGVSIYNAVDLEGLNPDLLDVVQLPLSLFDQRLLQDGTIELLHEQGISIHARSIFLQGLIVASSQTWPDWVDEKMRTHQHNLEKLAKNKDCSLLDLALGFAKEQKELEAIVVGVCSLFELSDIILSWSQTSPWSNREWKSWSMQELTLLDPRLWPLQ